jgi:EAL domain-containing protein (putative c-di-GMP-specific phosphodiesterase class I)/GGDEF domain-containing protein
MLLSQKEERGRRFTLALRAGIPVLVLISLVFFNTFYHKEHTLSIKDGFLLVSLTFITIYFIYFLMNLSVQETIIDEITQGFNKRAFIERLPHYEPSVLGLLSIENLESLSENYSIEQIDSLLYTLTQRLHLRFNQAGFKKPLIARQKGSEFLIALQEEEGESLERLLKRFVQESAILNEFSLEYRYSVIKNTNNDYEKMLLQLRDLITSQSMRGAEPTEAKSQNFDATSLSLIEKDVIRAIEDTRLLLSFRPLLDTKREEITIYEISVKLQSLHQPDILPRVFLPIINRLGLGREYDFMLISHLIDLLPLVDDTISFSFNLSPFSLREKSFQERLFGYLNEKQVDPSRLIIQLYERKTHHDLSGYLKTLKTFRAKGLRICIDNFGSSNASMEYMKHFKFDMVQFDRDYVTKLDNPTTFAMLQSLVSMSKELGITTVAKWVDNENQKRHLRHIGVDYIQGFGVSHPIDERQLIEHYNKG